MHQTTKDLKAELEKDAKDAWDKLEPTLEATLERAAKDVSNGSHVALAELTEAHRKLREWRR
jgi:hypothetical protein